MPYTSFNNLQIYELQNSYLYALCIFYNGVEKNLAFIGAVEAPNVNRTVSLDTLFDIAEALDVAPHRFLEDDK